MPSPFYELDIIEYSNSVVGDDYLEMMRTFLERIEEQIKSIELGREMLGIPNEPFLAKHIVPQSHCGEYTGKLMVVRAEVLRPEYRNMAHQLVLPESGNGCTPRGLGSAVYSTTLATGKHHRFERMDFLGELRPECVPDWAKAALDKIQLEKQAKECAPRKKQREER